MGVLKMLFLVTGQFTTHKTSTKFPIVQNIFIEYFWLKCVCKLLSTPLRFSKTAIHVWSSSPLRIDNCLHGFWLKVDCIPNGILVEPFPRFVCAWVMILFVELLLAGLWVLVNIGTFLFWFDHEYTTWNSCIFPESCQFICWRLCSCWKFVFSWV